MRIVENAALAIFEYAEQQSQSNGDVGDVRDRHEHMTVGRQRTAREAENRRCIAQMLEHVGEYDRVGTRETFDPLEVCDQHLMETAEEIGEAIDFVFEADGS